MTVIEFTPKSTPGPAGWRDSELARIVQAIDCDAGRRVGGWDVGATEAGDPQLYVLGEAPASECILCISRLGGTYVVEDGGGRIVGEHNSLAALAVEARNYLRKGSQGVIARIALVWCTLRQALEQKVDGVLTEGEDVLVHLVPQAAALV